MAAESRLATGLQKLQDIAALLTASRDDREDVGNKASTTGAVRALAGLAPEHSMTQCAFGGVVGWFDAWRACECPQCGLQTQQFGADRCRLGAAASAAEFEPFSNPVADEANLPLKSPVCAGAVTDVIPGCEHGVALREELLADPLASATAVG